LEGRLCAGQEVALVAGAIPPGRRRCTCRPGAKVWLIVRGASLAASMSRYLVERIAATPNIEMLTQTTVSALEGRDGVLESGPLSLPPIGEEVKRAIRHLFLFIGANRVPSGWPGPV